MKTALLILIVAILTLSAQFLIVAILTLSAQSSNPLYMVIYRGARGLNFYCLDYLPIAPSQDLIWDTELGATELYEDAGELVFQIVQVDNCNLTNVYQLEDNRHYALGFSSHNTDGHPNHRHITGLASWVERVEIVP